MEEKTKSCTAIFLRLKEEAAKQPKTLDARASQMLTCPAIATIFPVVEVYTLETTKMGYEHHTNTIPNSAKAIILYEDRQAGLFQVKFLFPRMIELTRPIIPPKAKAREGYPLSGMKSLHSICELASQINVPIQDKKKTSPKPILPITQVYPAQMAREAPIASKKEAEGSWQLVCRSFPKLMQLIQGQSKVDRLTLALESFTPTLFQKSRKIKKFWTVSAKIRSVKVIPVVADFSIYPATIERPTLQTHYQLSATLLLSPPQQAGREIAWSWSQSCQYFPMMIDRSMRSLCFPQWQYQPRCS